LRTKGSAPTAEFWVCDRCKSLNQRWAMRCYRCQEPRRIDPQILSADGPSVVWTAGPDARVAAGASAPVAIGRYRPSTLRAAFAISFIGLATVLGLAVLGVTAAPFIGGGRQDWTDFRMAFFAESNRRILVACVGLLLASYVGAAISWLAWLSRAIDNVPALGGGRPSTSPRGTVMAWFVPFVNLAKPYWILRDLHDRLAVPGRRSAPLRAWWVCWLPTGLNLTLIGVGLTISVVNLGLVVIPLVLLASWGIDPLVGLGTTAALAWALAGFFVRGRGLRIVALTGLVVAALAVLGVVLRLAVQRALESGTSLADILATVQQVSLVLSVVGSSAWILTGLFSISIVIEIERRQHLRARLSAGEPAGAAA